MIVVPAADVVAFLHPLPVGRAVGRGGEDREGADPARAAHGRRHRPHPAVHPGAGPRPGDRLAPARAVLGPRRAHRRAARAGQEHRRRGDLRPRRRRPRGRAARAAAAQREDGCPAALGRAGRPDGQPQGAVRRLHDDHPVPDPARGDRRRSRRLRHRPRRSSRRWGSTGPGCGWSGSGSSSWSAPRRRPTSCCSASATGAAARPSRPPTGPPCGSASGAVRPASLVP